MSWVTWPTWPPCPYMVKTLKKSSSPEAIGRWPWKLVCSIVYASITKVVQIMTLGWPWHILRQGQIWSHRLVYGKKWKLFMFFFFGNYCSLVSQSDLKHSAKLVNEVEWVSKVKVILWPWSKVTQISKLNVWLWACILRWAIQGHEPSCYYIVWTEAVLYNSVHFTLLILLLRAKVDDQISWAWFWGMPDSCKCLLAP